MAPRLALLALALPLPAQAETPIAEVLCAPRADMAERLSIRYRADIAATGLRDRDAVIEVWADPQGRWTLVQRYANGVSCILAVGEGWAPVLPPA